ncbi:MAG TPA: VOC family protein [Pyrinomonadaceae bacterium]|jgi:hypothetical protein
MTKELWLNLPVGDVEKTKEFFNQIGFKLNEKHTDSEMACFSVGEKGITVLFFAEETFKGFTKNEVSNTKSGSEVLISFDGESREEIEETARKVFEAGGTIFSPPAEFQNWMYSFGFVDLDGHRWNMVYMDESRLQCIS